MIAPPGASEPMPAAEDQFVLSTVRSEGQFNTTIYEREDSYRQVQSRWIVLMNPNDMAELNLSAADRVTLISDHGRMEGVQAHPFGLPAKNLLAYFPEANVLTNTAVDPESKTPAFKLTPVRIKPS